MGSDSASIGRVTGEPSVTSALERFLAASQGVITKRIDLALLEAQELLSRALSSLALIGCSLIVAAGAWFSLAAWLVLWVAPTATLAARCGLFGLLNAGAALGFATLARRRAPLQTPLRRNGVSHAVAESTH